MMKAGGRGKVDTSKITLVMVGPTGQGKSTLGNLIAGGGAGYQPFTTSDDFDSETIEASHADFDVHNRAFRTIDTIGFLDTRMDAAQNMDKFAGFADRAPGGIDAFLFVLKKGRFTEQSLGQISAFRAVAGDEALKHTILIFTHSGKETNQELADRCHSSTNQHLRTAVECCQDVLGADSLSPDRCEDDRVSVLDSVQNLVKLNNGQKYDNTTLLEARKRRDELEHMISGLSQERREAMQDKLDGLFMGRFTFDQVSAAIEQAKEYEERQKKEEAERISMKALLEAAKSEAAAWKEVAKNVLMSRSGGAGGALGLAGCCAPQQGSFDAGEVNLEGDHGQGGMGMGAGPPMGGGGGGQAMGGYAGPAPGSYPPSSGRVS